tara:strand:+ start:91 stop:387 length:297 start_codon:yes stop_codon:yes gene_type:complete
MNSGALCVPCGSDIAIALHTLPHRAVSLALVAQALGATQGKGQLRKSIESLSEASFSEFSLPRVRPMASFSLPKGRIGSRKKVLTAVEVEVSSTQDGV